MECTQQIECTQEIYENVYKKAPKPGPKQIGFLGICGSKYPLNKGPNKVGRDPDTCNVVLNDSSISRQHAVINILNDKDFMLMDLDSSNKTKLLGTTLQPYIPHPLKNGDTVQFGQAFGIFRLLEEDDDLPMTQAVDIPETPVRQVTRLNVGPKTVIPESPDVSDRDDSIIAQSQPKKTFPLKSTNRFIKSTTTLKVGMKEIDNVYWSSSKKSDSFSSQLDTNSSVLDGNTVSPKKNIVDENNIFDLETQAPVIFEAKTQIPSKVPSTIHNLDTQLPNTENLPEVYRVKEQNNVQLNIYTSNKRTIDIFEAETQVELQDKVEKVPASLPGIVTENIKPTNEAISGLTENKLNTSDEEIIFDDCEEINFDNCESQPLLSDYGLVEPLISDPPKILDSKNKSSSDSNVKDHKYLNSESRILNHDDEDLTDCEDNMIEIAIKDKPITSDPKILEQDEDITDCEDNMIELAIKDKPITSDPKILEQDEDITDCEDNMIELAIKDKPITSDPKILDQDDEDITDFEDNMIKLAVKDKPAKTQSDDDLTDCEDVISNIKVNEIRKPDDDDVTDCEDDVIEISQNRTKTSDVNDLENLPTQVIEEENLDAVPFEEMLTQVIDQSSPKVNLVEEQNNSNPAPFEDMATQVLEVDEDQLNSKSPLISNKDIFKVPHFSPKLRRKDVTGVKKSNDIPIKNTPVTINVDREEGDPNYYNATQEIVNDLCTQMEITNNNSLIKDRSSEESDGNERVQSFVSKLSKEQIREVIGLDVAPLTKKKSSDSSDIELTPTKFTPTKFLSMNLPDSQDIKSCKFVCTEKPESDSDPFEPSQEEEHEESSFFPNISRKKKVKQNLCNKFDVDALPTRAITRIRKPTTKLLDCDESSKKMAEKILQSRLGLDSTKEIDTEVVNSNLARARRRMENTKIKLATSNRQSDESEIREKIEKTISDDKPHRNIDKKLKQPDIKSMFKEIKVKDNSKDEDKTKTESKECANENRRSSRNKHKREKNEKSPPEVKPESCDRKHKSSRSYQKEEPNDCEKQTIEVENSKIESRKHKRSHSHKRDDTNVEARQKTEVKDEKSKSESRRKHSSRTHKREETNDNGKEVIKVKLGLIDLTSQEDKPVVRRSKRKAAQDEIEAEKELSRKSNEKKDINQDKEHRNRTRSSNKTSTNSQSKSLNSLTEKESQANLKRKAGSIDNLPGVSKKTKLSNASSKKQCSVEATSTRGVRKHCVLFTAFPADLVKGKLEKFGAEIVDNVRNCTVVLTLKIRRTFKLLCAIGLGIPIVGPTWVQACVDSGTIVDPWLYLINDEESEKRFHFSLRNSLSAERNFLKGYNISCTPNVSPNPQEMQSIIECSGGTWGEGGKKWYCVSCPQDKPLIPTLKRRGAIVVNNEFILCGVLRQKLLDKDKFSIP